jgi:hypothetical protein
LALALCESVLGDGGRNVCGLDGKKEGKVPDVLGLLSESFLQEIISHSIGDCHHSLIEIGAYFQK